MNNLKYIFFLALLCSSSYPNNCPTYEIQGEYLVYKKIGCSWIDPWNTPYKVTIDHFADQIFEKIIEFESGDLIRFLFKKNMKASSVSCKNKSNEKFIRHSFSYSKDSFWGFRKFKKHDFLEIRMDCSFLLKEI